MASVGIGSSSGAALVLELVPALAVVLELLLMWKLTLSMALA